MDPYEGAQASDEATREGTLALRVQGTVVTWDLAAQPHRWLQVSPPAGLGTEPPTQSPHTHTHMLCRSGSLAPKTAYHRSSRGYGVTETRKECHIRGEPFRNFYEEECRMLLPVPGRLRCGWGVCLVLGRLV